MGKADVDSGFSVDHDQVLFILGPSLVHTIWTRDSLLSLTPCDNQAKIDDVIGLNSIA